jgi:hypothetical protein
MRDRNKCLERIGTRCKRAPAGGKLMKLYRFLKQQKTLIFCFFMLYPLLGILSKKQIIQ